MTREEAEKYVDMLRGIYGEHPTQPVLMSPRLYGELMEALQKPPATPPAVEPKGDET